MEYAPLVIVLLAMAWIGLGFWRRHREGLAVRIDHLSVSSKFSLDDKVYSIVQFGVNYVVCIEDETGDYHAIDCGKIVKLVKLNDPKPLYPMVCGFIPCMSGDGGKAAFTVMNTVTDEVVGQIYPETCEYGVMFIPAREMSMEVVEEIVGQYKAIWGSD